MALRRQEAIREKYGNIKIKAAIPMRDADIGRFIKILYDPFEIIIDCLRAFSYNGPKIILRMSGAGSY